MQTTRQATRTSSTHRTDPSPSSTRLERHSDHVAIRYHVLMLCGTGFVLLAAAWFELSGETRVALPIGQIVLPEICSFRNLTGLSCPGCGLTRSFISLMDGEVRAAWRFNPAGLALFAAALFQFPYRAGQIWRLARGRREWRSSLWLYTAWALVAAVLVQWIWRVLV